MTPIDITDLGWDETLNAAFEPHRRDGHIPARVAREDRGAYVLRSAAGELTGEVSGRFRHDAPTKADFPAVGDWVACECLATERKAVIHGLLPRRSCFLRQVAGSRTEAQVVAANVDTVFIVNGLDGGRNFNLRRLERYIALAWESGAEPVVVLNKADLCPDPDAFSREAETAARGLPTHVVSATSRVGLGDLRRYLAPGRTVAFLGSSGVGKSALINALLGTERQAVNAQRHGDRQGRHTTTHRELILLPQGGLVIDTPGMRELQMWGDDSGVSAAFDDVEQLATDCRFRDCTHAGEPGCAVHTAVEEGRLEATRLESYHKLQKEMAHVARRTNLGAQLAEKAKWKAIAKWSKELYRGRE